jgi:hypothetical protein
MLTYDAVKFILEPRMNDFNVLTPEAIEHNHIEVLWSDVAPAPMTQGKK